MHSHTLSSPPRSPRKTSPSSHWLSHVGTSFSRPYEHITEPAAAPPRPIAPDKARQDETRREPTKYHVSIWTSLMINGFKRENERQVFEVTHRHSPPSLAGSSRVDSSGPQ